MVTGYFASYFRCGSNSLWICLLQVEKFTQSCLWAFTKKEAYLGLSV